MLSLERQVRALKLVGFANFMAKVFVERWEVFDNKGLINNKKFYFIQ